MTSQPPERPGPGKAVNPNRLPAARNRCGSAIRDPSVSTSHSVNDFSEHRSLVIFPLASSATVNGLPWDRPEAPADSRCGVRYPAASHSAMSRWQASLHSGESHSPRSISWCLFVSASWRGVIARPPFRRYIGENGFLGTAPIPFRRVSATLCDVLPHQNCRIGALRPPGRFCR